MNARIPGSGKITVKDRLMVVQFSGYTTATTLSQVLPEIKRLTATRGNVDAVIFDTLAMTGFHEVNEGGRAMLEALRDAGVTCAVAVVNSGTIRMIGMAISFAARLPVEFVPTLEEAHALVKRKMGR